MRPALNPTADQCAQLLAKYRQAGVAERSIPVALKAIVAGSRGRHAEPLDAAQRAERYVRQRSRRAATPAQARRIRHKANRAKGPEVTA